MAFAVMAEINSMIVSVPVRYPGRWRTQPGTTVRGQADLDGIRNRINGSRAQRADLRSWSFYQLRGFVVYKAAMAGLRCGWSTRATRAGVARCAGMSISGTPPSRDVFRCLSCGHAAPADHNAATNIGRRAAVMRPHAA